MSRTNKKNAVTFLIALLITMVLLFPMYWILVSSLKTDAEILTNRPSFWFKVPRWENYISQLSGSFSLLITAPNSIVTALANVLITMMLGVPAAYGLGRYHMKFKKEVILFFLTTQMLPASLLLTPMYLMYSKVGLLNTRLAPILSIATISIPFTIVVLRPIFKQSPVELEEAARIDGCNTFQVFWKIMLPISRPGIVTIACFSFVHGWNNLIYNMTFNTSSESRTMTSCIYRLMNEQGTKWNQIMAYGVILTLPVIILFILGQKYIISGMTAGAVKS